MLITNHGHHHCLFITLYLVYEKAQRLPSASYPLFDAIPSDVTETGKLSDLQLEGILYAVSKNTI